jgi:glycine hydroxymethyltransferase
VLGACRAEQRRQWRALVMIPSESICHPEAAAVLTSELDGVYAEGLPQPVLSHDARADAADELRFGSWQRRLADRRFYKGTVNANRVELIAHERIAQTFARLAGSPGERDIHVNVQPLSGAVANLAVYDALLKPGDRIMGLDLSHGGHLTHGSVFNFSGKTYRVRSYGVDPATRRLDYGRIRLLAQEWRPQLIIGGASAYPWDFDWAELRSIADEVGAYVLADIAHLAGMVAAGILNNPLPHAHVVTFTTHKTLCGPRGAAILATDPALARKVDMAVFPGMQGGPHMNSIAAIARLFELILEDYEGFCRLQRGIVSNARFFAECLAEEGFALEYGGTNTHMLLVDLKPLPVEGEMPLDGEIASRLLEIAGIVCNKNVLPGDGDAAHASGLRFGLPWLTQRGVTGGQLREIAGIVRSVLTAVRTVPTWSPAGEKRCRGRVPPGVLSHAAQRTLAIAQALPYPAKPAEPPRPPAAAAVAGRVALLLRGEKVRLALDRMLSARMPAGRQPVRALMLDAAGRTIDDVVAVQSQPAGREERWYLFPHRERVEAVRLWIEELSDGYLLFDPADLQQKVDGPTVVEDASDVPAEVLAAVEGLGAEPAVDLTKPYFIGQGVLYRKAPPLTRKDYSYAPAEVPLRRTVLNAVHCELGARMAPFAGWEMPIQYPSGILAEHRAVRTAAGLFDVSHMSALEVSGPDALPFLESLVASCVSRLDPGEAQYSCILSPDGAAIDDVFLYRLEPDRFMLVVNAANAERAKGWMAAVNSHRFIVDRQMPGKRLDGPVALRDLRDAGEDSLVGLALQGPASLTVLQKLAEKGADRAALGRLVQHAHIPVRLAGMAVRVARTGYTGEKTGFELYVHPDRACELWRALLEAGRLFGLLPAGLGARDSTRVEAGFPLFGHDLEGPLGISMAEAGYGFVARFHVPFFIGRKPYMERDRSAKRHMIRLRGQGRRTLRPGHAILDGAGQPVGQVTSFAYVHEDMTFVVLACVADRFLPAPGEIVRGARTSAAGASDKVEERSIVEMTALGRFPDDAERDGWRARYA